MKDIHCTTGFIFVYAAFAWFFRQFGKLKFAFYPRLDKCHRHLQIFLVSFADFDSSEVLVSFLELFFSENEAKEMTKKSWHWQ